MIHPRASGSGDVPQSLLLFQTVAAVASSAKGVRKNSGKGVQNVRVFNLRRSVMVIIMCATITNHLFCTHDPTNLFMKKKIPLALLAYYYCFCLYICDSILYTTRMKKDFFLYIGKKSVECIKQNYTHFGMSH